LESEVLEKDCSGGKSHGRFWRDLTKQLPFDGPVDSCDKEVIMPLESPDQQFFDAACGYVQLQMFHEANEELEKIDPFLRAAPEVLALRIEIYRGLQKWELMAELAKRLAEFQPNDVQWTVLFAYATRRAESIEAAKEILLSAKTKFPKEAVILYNLACYECQLGNLQSAQNYLQKVFNIDSNWRIAALDDKDLEPLWNGLG
jgi:tetratricopeptide (TPR) repeat protein